MPRVLHRLMFLGIVMSAFALVAASDAPIVSDADTEFELLTFPLDTPETDSTALPWPLQDSYDPTPTGNENGLYLNDPSNIETNIEYDPESGEYNINQTVGEDMNFRPPTYMSFDEYQDYNATQSLRDYWREKSGEQSEAQRKPLIPKLNIKSKLFETIFGGSTVEIRPQGSAELIFGINVSKIKNPALPAKQQTNTSFNFDQSIQMNVTGKIGEKMQLGVNYNTDATFDFENEMKLAYEGEEDDIIQLIEAGNVSLPLTGSLISGSQNLFGVKTALKFGRLTMTAIFSQQKSETNSVVLENGAQITEFEVKADEYEEDRHYFLSQYFRNNYDEWLSELPLVRSPVNISRIEVWVTNTKNATENTRNIVAFLDLGETPSGQYNQTLIGPGSGNQTVPNNSANDLYAQMTGAGFSGVRDVDQVPAILGPLAGSHNFVSSQDYAQVKLARRLTTSEYTFNAQLGYLSVTGSLAPNEVLAVAYQYTYGGQVFQVGEFSTDGISGENALFLKMLKSTVTNPKIPLWDLMMKNVYNIGAYNMEREGFRLDVIYDNIEAGTRTNYITEGAIEGEILIKTMNLDQLNSNNDPFADGFFDFVEGITINSQNGRIYFPVVEPFGDHLESKFNPGEQEIADRYVYHQLYDSTRQSALNFPELNRFILGGTYRGKEGGFISLGGMNIPEGSVTVTVGSQKLSEGADYRVDYALGRVYLHDQGLMESGAKVTATYESNSLFNIQQKTLGGVHLDYEISKDLLFGATILNLSERPLTQKVNMGNEPINNTIWGVNGNYRSESRLLTKIVDKIPFINTKEVSSIAVTGEFAHLIPGNARAITKGGIAYIDDFEGSVNFIDLKSQFSWALASTPQGQPEAGMFPEGSLYDDIGNGMNRAKLAWYVIDPLFFRNNNLTPNHLSPEDKSFEYSREVLEQEIFPNKESLLQGQQTNLPIFDVAYYPNEKGPYNYDSDGITPNGLNVAEGLETDGSLKDPASRWGGIMRSISTSNFEENNIEFIQFWMMDPYHLDAQNQHSGGDLYFNLGGISEDILYDGNLAFENGLPTPDNQNAVDTTNWGIVPNITKTISAFDNEPTNRPFQDIGLDGLNDDQELAFHTTNSDYVQRLTNMVNNLELTQTAFDRLSADISSDNFGYYRGDDLDAQAASVLERYKPFNGHENNSPTADQSGTSFQASSTTLPNEENVDRIDNMNGYSGYYQYKVSLRKEDMIVGKNYITDEVVGQGVLDNGQTIDVKWYQFKIPVRSPDKVVGDIQNFTNIFFMRMFFKGFEDSIVARFARLELVRAEWRRYLFSLEEPGEYIPGDPTDESPFDISVVNIEENGNKDPVNYILPPGIDRQQTPSGNQTLRQLNEQSLLLKVCDLADGDARAAYKNTEFDIRSYKKLKMFIHAEAVDPEILNDDDVTVFLRLGTDFDNNYYEYELPLKVTPEGNYDQNSQDDRYDVWPLLNNIELEFKELTKAKQERNRALVSDPTVSVTKRYVIDHGPRNTIAIRGNPNLANIKSLMIGIRNPKKTGPNDGDDGLAKCVEVWVNELRLTDFDNKGGWASLGQVNVKLADFANLSAAADYTKFGFGAFDSKPSGRERESTINYDLATTIALGKFFPKKWGINVPMYLSFSETFATPEYNPLDPDITMAASLSELEQTSENPVEAKKTLKQQSQTYIKRRSMNFTDIRKQRTGKGKPMPWDVSNFGFNYAYNEQYQRDIRIAHSESRNYRGGMDYGYSPKGKNVKPFAKLKLVNAMVDATKERQEKKQKEQKVLVDSLKRANVKGEEMKEAEEKLEKYTARRARYKKWSRKMLRSGWWRPIKDFNFNYLPKQLGFRTDADRRYSEQKLRNTTAYDLKIERTFQKSFLWNREYHFKYDLTKAIKIQFDAFNFGRIDEPQGIVDRKDESWEHVKDSIWSNILDGGRTTQYNHTTTLNWTLPINKLPITSWITSNASYTGNYTWDAAPLAWNDTLQRYAQGPFGNTIQNSQNWQINGNANFTQLYNKIPFLKKINRNSRKTASARKAQAKKKTVKGGKPEPGDSTEVEKKPKVNVGKIIGESTARFLMMLKSANVTYSESNGTLLPGYNPKTDYMGIDNEMGNNAGFAPFLFGWQQYAFDDVGTGYDIREEAIKGNWIARDSLQSNPYVQTQSSSLNIRATLEPIKGFRIDLTATRTYTESVSEFFRWDEALQEVLSSNPITTGNFSMSYISANTAFIKPRKDNTSQVFDDFKANRLIISQRLADDYPGFLPQDSAGYYDGYGATQQDVLIPAFLSAYGVFDAKKVSTNPFSRIPLPNWRVNYDGIGKIPLVKKFARNVTFGHAYRSTYSVSSFTTNLAFEGIFIGDKESTFPNTRDSSNNFVPGLQIGSVTISEQFSPLFSLNFNFKNSLTAKLEMKTTRILSLNFSNNQLTEVTSEEYIVGVGYTFKNVPFPIRFSKGQKKIRSDLQLRLDFSLRDNRTMIRKLEEDLNQPTSGQKLISIKFNADYVINQRFSIRLFYNAAINKPVVSSSFPTENHSAGLSLRFSLAD